MTTRVYQFGCLAPRANISLVRDQLVAAHRYRNLLVWIECGRRAALRALQDTLEVREAVELLRAATRSTRSAARRAVHVARRNALLARSAETDRIAGLDAEIRRQARKHTTAYWGTYLTIEASADQTRKMPLWDRTGLEPSDPRPVRWGTVDDAPAGQIGIQIQRPTYTEDVLDCEGTWCRLEIRHRKRNGEQLGVLAIRVGSAGKDPIWTDVPVKLHRPLPAGGRIRWVRLSRRLYTGLARGWTSGERWSCEITVELPEGAPSMRPPRSSRGVVALELGWAARGDTICVGRWIDDTGSHGEILVPERTTRALRKASDIRAVRDTLREEMAHRFVAELRRSRDPRPPWLRDALNAEAWQSPARFHRLVRRWREESCDAAREAYEILQAWELRDEHLWSYESGARRGALAHRLDTYRVLARRWSEQYAVAVVPDRDLSREARWGPDGDRRFAAGPSELRQAIAHVFGSACVEHPWAEDDPDSDDPSWFERAIVEGRSRLARSSVTALGAAEKGSGAWVKRKVAKRERLAKTGPLETISVTTEGDS